MPWILAIKKLNQELGNFFCDDTLFAHCIFCTMTFSMLIMNDFQTIHGLINNVPIKTVQTDISLHDMNTLIYKIKEQEMRMTAAYIFFIDMIEWHVYNDIAQNVI